MMKETDANYRLEQYRRYMAESQDPTISTAEIPKRDLTLLITAYDEAKAEIERLQNEVAFVQDKCTQRTEERAEFQRRMHVYKGKWEVLLRDQEILKSEIASLKIDVAEAVENAELKDGE